MIVDCEIVLIRIIFAQLAMRDAFQKLGGDAKKINPLCPADLVIDHSVQVDFSRV